jgi:outer membrane protein assembly factor BamE (lipoprotein component of BamABCDE complex)
VSVLDRLATHRTTPPQLNYFEVIKVHSRCPIATLVCATLVLAAATSLIAQNRVEPIPSSLPTSLEVSQPPAVSKISLGQTQQEVIKILGRPKQYVLDHVKGGDMAEVWELSPQDTLVVTFRKNIVRSFRHIYSQSAHPSMPAPAPLSSTENYQRAYDPVPAENANLGHQNDDGTWSTGGGQSGPAKRVSIGQAKEEVLRIFGRPNGPPPSQHILDRAKPVDSIGIWTLSPRDMLVVAFRDDKVSSFWHEDTEGNTPSAPSKTDTVLGKVGQVADSLYFTSVCPAIYRKPALLMTAGDVQVLQACNANGFMLFGVYLYTGGR